MGMLFVIKGMVRMFSSWVKFSLMRHFYPKQHDVFYSPPRKSARSAASLQLEGNFEQWFHSRAIVCGQGDSKKEVLLSWAGGAKIDFF